MAFSSMILKRPLGDEGMSTTPSQCYYYLKCWISVSIIHIYLCLTYFVVAVHYGKYWSEAEIKSKVKPGVKLDILCTDGLNYHVDVKAFDKSTGSGHLHFCRWSIR